MEIINYLKLLLQCLCSDSGPSDEEITIIIQVIFETQGGIEVNPEIPHFSEV